MLLCGNITAQTLIKGVVVSSIEPIPYATIGLKGKDIGTVANEKGAFVLNLKDENLSVKDELLISSVGFISKVIKYKEFIGIHSPVTITLNKNNIALTEITVKPKKKKEKKFGKTGVPKFTSAVMFTRYELVDDALGREIGGVIKIDKDIKLKDFNIYVWNQFKNIKFRLKFYDLTEEDTPVLISFGDDIIFDVNIKNGWVKVNLQSYNIFIEGKKRIGVTIQWLKSESFADANKNIFLTIPAAISPFSKGLLREKSEALWTFPKINLSMYLTADSYSD